MQGQVQIIRGVPNVRAVKEASGNFSQLTKIVSEYSDRLDIYCGNDDQAIAALALGAKGIISVLSNICPKEVSELCYAFFAGDIKRSEEIQKKYEELNKTLFSDINPIRFTADGDLYETEVKVEHQEHDSYCMICCKNAMGHRVSARN